MDNGLIYLSAEPFHALPKPLEEDGSKPTAPASHPLCMSFEASDVDVLNPSTLLAAWAILVASYATSDNLHVSRIHPNARSEVQTVTLNWVSPARKLIADFQQPARDIRPGEKSHEASSGPPSDVVKRNPGFETFPEIRVEISGLLSTTEPLTVKCYTKDRNVFIEAMGLNDSSSATALLGRVQRQFVDTVHNLCSQDILDLPLGDLKVPTLTDLAQVWTWNSHVPEGLDNICIHEMFEKRVQKHPRLPAVAAHDANFSYEELSNLSTRLAGTLMEGGIQPNSVVLVLIEKSAWVPVAQLAIMKCGCVSTVLDASLPFARHQAIAELAQASGILTSPTCESQASALGVRGPLLSLSTSSSEQWSSLTNVCLPRVSPSAYMYLVFTSGSTGTPKGAIISHANYASAVATQQNQLDFREYDRVFDFASYAFDASWCNFIHAITIGGCLCIPSDGERKSDLAGALRKYRVNYAVLTPSVAWFPVSELPASLRTIHFGGEPLHAALVKELSKRITVINAYGPAECSTVSTAFVTDPNSAEDPIIGTGLGCCTWVIKLDGSDIAPIGEVGELWMEGPIVGQGYLRNPEKTANTFVENPSWLSRGCPNASGIKGHTGRKGRLYRSGDLVRYKSDGNLEFVGRCDSQVKIRGQRTELAEVETNIHRALSEEARSANVQVAAEVVKLQGSDIATLICFVFQQTRMNSTVDAPDFALSQALLGLEERLVELVPPYMVPSAFFPVDSVPMTPTGKVDRRRLRQAGVELYEEQRNAGVSDTSSPDETVIEYSLREVWSEVLGLAMYKIGLDSVFTRLGGDSITAMQVVSRCRQRNLACKVADILRLQTVHSLAVTCKPIQNKLSWSAAEQETEEPWALTPIQQIFFKNNSEGYNHYTLSFIVKLTRPTSFQELDAALLELTSRHQMLRARFRKKPDGSEWQQFVVPSGKDSYALAEHEYLSKESMQKIVNNRQATIDIIDGPVFAVDMFNVPGEDQTLLMSAHHLVMDLVSWRTIWHEMGEYLSRNKLAQRAGASFKTWCRLQREEGARLDPRAVLPFEVEPSNLDYWGIAADELIFKNSSLNISVVGEQATALLLGPSNDCLQTETLDILLGTLMHCFAHTFPDRSVPAIFLEGHGREPPSDVEDFDMSDIVGWFTSLYPVQVNSPAGVSVIETIRSAKDVRRSIPGKGRPYLACRFHSAAGREAFESHDFPEVIFNYRGSFQQLEDAKSVIRLEDRPWRNPEIPGDGSEYHRPSIVDINLVVQEGKLQVWTRYHARMAKAEVIVRWVDWYAKLLNSIAVELCGLPRRYTLVDFSRLSISYQGLDSLMDTLPRELGIQKNDVQDILPCTPIQEGIVFSSAVGAASYSTVSVWRVESNDKAVCAAQLATAWKTVAATHPILSTVFSTHPDTGRFIQVILKTANEPRIIIVPEGDDLVEHLNDMPAAQVSSSQPACLFTVAVDQNQQVACRLDISHALMDALSLPVLVKDLLSAYAQRPLPIRTPFSKFVEYLSTTSSSSRLSYWKQYLKGVQPCNVPGDKVPAGAETPHEVQYEWYIVPEKATMPIAKICREQGLTRSIFLHIAWSLVLSYFTGMREVCFGYVASGRDAPINDIEGVVGPLINMLIARLNLDQPLSSVVDTATKYNIGHIGAQHVSLAELQDDIGTKQLFNTNITVRESRRKTETVDGQVSFVEMVEKDPHEYDLVLAGVLENEVTEVKIQYRKDHFSALNARQVGLLLQRAIEFLTGSGFLSGSNQTQTDNGLYAAYFNHLTGYDEATALRQWQTHFADLDAGCCYPSIPSAARTVAPNASIVHNVKDIAWAHGHSKHTQIVASWALLQGSYGRSQDIIVGVEGGLRHGPCHKFNLPAPARVQLDMSTIVSHYLDRVDEAVAACQSLPQLALHRLTSSNPSLALAHDFQTVIYVRGHPQHDKDQACNANIEATRALNLTFSTSDSGFECSASFDDSVVTPQQVRRLLWQFETVLKQVSLDRMSCHALTELETISSQDLQDISVWNQEQYEQVQILVHDLIAEVTVAMPDAPAISAWDGELTYRQLDDLTDCLAKHLVERGVQREVVVPMLFEKSVWTAVSAVAVIKAGGAGVMIDTAQPAERFRRIVQQCSAKLVLFSRANEARSTQLGDVQALVVDKTLLDQLSKTAQAICLPRDVEPDNLLYCSFTSGSTGTPKGAMITHSQFSSAIKHQHASLGFKRGQRVYDFASYAFDAAWSNLLHSLTSGSCLCIPAEEERSNQLAQSIKNRKATLLNITPSILRYLDPTDFPHLEQVLMGGEAWAESDFLEWIDKKRLINAYGPGECTIKTCLLPVVRGMVPNTLGPGIGLHTWIVRTDGSERLAPLGSTGELWLEGPQVGRGYLADKQKTAASFVTHDLWTDPKSPTCRFYRTGDIVRYGADGGLVFVARKDSQVKIRGQRTEPGEIESNILKALGAAELKAQIIADVLKPKGSQESIVVAFVKPEDASVRLRLADLGAKLTETIPEYMVPSTYIVLDKLPMTATGKVNRRELRELYSQKTLQQLNALNSLNVSSYREPTTQSERLLATMWAEVLGIDAQAISADDSFLRIGGNSLGAMRLVSSARLRGFTLSVAEIFKHPVLAALAEIIDDQETMAPTATRQIRPFSLLKQEGPVESIKSEAAALCGLDSRDIEDVFPCTPLQAGLLAEMLRRPGDNILTQTKKLKSSVNPERLKSAWQAVVRDHPILRTRIIDLPEEGLVQVVVSHQRCQTEAAIVCSSFGLGTSLVSCKIDDNSFTWSILHALYDGWSEPLIFEALNRHYEGQAVRNHTPFQAFIKYLNERSQAEADHFWADQFKYFSAEAFPAPLSASYKPQCDQCFIRGIDVDASQAGFTAATRIRLAWAILLATITHSEDASFGSTVSGRQADIPGIEWMTGPTFATVPLRVAVDRSRTVEQLLEQVQTQAVEMIAFEQTGIQNIRRINAECDLGCQFQTLVVVQTDAVPENWNTIFEDRSADSGLQDEGRFKHYPICLEFFLGTESIALRAEYDSAVIPAPQMHRIIDRFEVILKQVSSPELGSTPLTKLKTTCARDIELVESWNDQSLQCSKRTIHSIFAETVARTPLAPAVCAWDGDFTYRELDVLSTRLAQAVHEVFATTDQDIVPLFFEKSKWTSVSQVAVMKASKASVVIAATLPVGRQKAIIELVRPRIILTSKAQEARARQVAPESSVVLVVADGEACLAERAEERALPVSTPDSWLYVVFTSGSTGTPKGVVLTHENLATAYAYGQGSLGFDETRRVLDYVSYAFDVSWLNLIYTLCCGACLCTPSQEQLHDGLKEVILNTRVNVAVVTPTVAKLLHGVDLEILNVGGEVMDPDEIRYWTKHCPTLMNTYGPSECTPTATSTVLGPDCERVLIGKGMGVHTWIVDPLDGKSLSAVGDIGELWLEGPTVAQGYLNNKQQTASVFIRDPPWASELSLSANESLGSCYRTGDLVRYAEDGSLEFIGRKDGQVKIHGQRVELGEIAHHISKALEGTISQAAVDIITPSDSNDPTLVAFIELPDTTMVPGSPQAMARARELAKTAWQALIVSLPAYMLPNGWLIVDEFPSTASSKLDRSKLRKHAATLKKQDLFQGGCGAVSKPQTPEEVELHTLIATVLARDPETFGMDDNFIHLGGDSISAMRLVSAARYSKLNLTVSKILTTSRVQDLLSIEAESLKNGKKYQIPHAVPKTRDLCGFTEQDILSSLKAGHGNLIDVLPATDMQATYLWGNICLPPRYWWHSFFDWTRIEDEARLVGSIKELVQRCEIYRTAFVRRGDEFFQAVFDKWDPVIKIIHEIDNIELAYDELVAEGLKQPVDLRSPLVQFTVMQGRNGESKLILAMSHAIYDAISLGHTLRILGEIYSGSIPEVQQFRSFVDHASTRRSQSHTFWRKTLEGCTLTKIEPANLDTESGTAKKLIRSVPLPRSVPGITPATVFTHACGHALQSFTGSEDVTFGRVVSGRVSLPFSVQDAVGPCLNRIPVRILFGKDRSRADRLVALQEQTTASIDYENVGPSDIAKHCADGWPQQKQGFDIWCQYQNVNEHPELALADAVSKMHWRQDEWQVTTVGPWALEFLAQPDPKNGTLKVTLLMGSAYSPGTASLLEMVCDYLCEAV